MSERARSLAALVAAVIRSFFRIKEEDSILSVGNKVSSAGIKWSSYYVIDWMIFALYGSVVGVMKYHDISFLVIFLVLWTLEITIASAFLLFYKITGKDITLGKNFREAWSETHARSRIIGVIALIVLAAKFVFWDGSERASMFFMKETGFTAKAMILLVVISATKMLAYVWLFSLGYDVFSSS